MLACDSAAGIRPARNTSFVNAVLAHLSEGEENLAGFSQCVFLLPLFA